MISPVVTKNNFGICEIFTKKVKLNFVKFEKWAFEKKNSKESLLILTHNKET